MKSCPACLREYQDDSLVYCLDDGSRLASNEFADGPETAFIVPPSGVPQPRAAEPSGTFRLGSVAPLLAGVVALAAIAYLVYAYLTPDPAGRIDSIAVMPFANESGNADFDYLSDGLTDTLIGRLNQIPNLGVKARSTVSRYRGREVNAREIGQELAVDAILIGRVVQRGQELTLYVELVDTNSENSLWQRTYNKVNSNLAALQGEIARDVAGNLQVRLSGADEKRLTRIYTQNAEASRLYLLGRFHYNKRTKTDIHKGIEFFRQAAEIDPNYALPYSGLSQIYRVINGYDPTFPRRDAYTRARENALKALALDDSLSEAHVSIGLIYQTVDHDFPGAERSLRRAIDLNPSNADAHASLGYLMMAFGRMSDAEASYQRALELEPVSLVFQRGYGSFLMFSRRYEESASYLEKAIDLEPNFALSYLNLAQVYVLLGRHAEAVELYITSREVLGADATARDAMRASFERGGWKGFVAEMDRNPWYVEMRPRYIRAVQYVSIGDGTRALDELENAYEERDGFIPLLNIDPRLDPVRSDPRFQALVKKIGIG